MREDHHTYTAGRQAHSLVELDMRTPAEMSPNELEEWREAREARWARLNEEKISTATAYLATCSPAEYAEVIERLHHSRVHPVSIVLPCTHIGNRLTNELALQSANHNGPYIDIWLDMDGERFTMEVE